MFFLFFAPPSQFVSISFFVHRAPEPVALFLSLNPRSIRMKQMEKVHADETIVVCTHGGCMLVLEAALTGMSAPHPT